MEITERVYDSTIEILGSKRMGFKEWNKNIKKSRFHCTKENKLTSFLFLSPALSGKEKEKANPEELMALRSGSSDLLIIYPAKSRSFVLSTLEQDLLATCLRRKSQTTL